MLFLGTAHSDRYRISNYVVNWCKKHNFSAFTYYYMQSKLVYFLKSKFDSFGSESDYGNKSIVTDKLHYYMDPANKQSYIGSGTSAGSTVGTVPMGTLGSSNIFSKYLFFALL